MVLAGGEGTRLNPLTSERSKPAVPFGSRYRIVDFVLSNLVNSGILSIYVLVQYKSQSLIEHVRKAWMGATHVPGQFITVMPPQMHEGAESFAGTSDAVYQYLHRLAIDRPSLVVVFGADHVYRMDVRQMIDFHRARNADVLAGELEIAKQRGEKDFGRHVLPRLVGTHRLYAYDFGTNRVPGTHPHEEPGYWRDVGALDAYYAANMDTLGDKPKLHLFNPRWPIHSSSYHGPAANVLRGEIENSHLGAGSLLRGATVRNSIIRREVLVEEDVVIEDSIILDYCVLRRGARVRRAIIDRYNVIGPGERIGYDAEADRARGHVTDSGIVVVAIAPVRGDTNMYE